MGKHIFVQGVTIPYFECKPGNVCNFPPKGTCYPIKKLNILGDTSVIFGVCSQNTSYYRNEEMFSFEVYPVNGNRRSKFNIFKSAIDVHRYFLSSVALTNEDVGHIYFDREVVKISVYSYQDKKYISHHSLFTVTHKEDVVFANVRTFIDKRKKELTFAWDSNAGTANIKVISYYKEDKNFIFSNLKDRRVAYINSMGSGSYIYKIYNIDNIMYIFYKFYDSMIKSSWMGLVMFDSNYNEINRIEKIIRIEKSEYPYYQNYIVYYDGYKYFYIVNNSYSQYNPTLQEWSGNSTIETIRISADINLSTVIPINKVTFKDSSFSISGVSSDHKNVYIVGVTDRGIVSPYWDHYKLPRSGFKGIHYPFIHAFEKERGASTGFKNLNFEKSKSERWSNMNIEANNKGVKIGAFVVDNWKHRYHKNVTEPKELWYLITILLKQSGKPDL